MNDTEQLLVNAVVIAKVIADALKEDNSYANIVKIADELKLEIYQLNQFIQLYKKVQQFMII